MDEISLDRYGIGERARNDRDFTAAWRSQHYAGFCFDPLNVNCVVRDDQFVSNEGSTHLRRQQRLFKRFFIFDRFSECQISDFQPVILADIERL